MKIYIRRALLADLPDIQQLQAESIRRLSTEHYNQTQIESLIVSQTVSATDFWPIVGPLSYVACCHDEIVGMASRAAWFSVINGLYVHPKWARRGIGSRLLQKIEATSIQRRHRQLSVTSSQVAVPFYIANGFEIVVKDRAIISGNSRIECAYMVKNLAR